MKPARLARYSVSLLVHNTFNSLDSPLPNIPPCHRFLVWAYSITRRTLRGFLCSFWGTVMMFVHKLDNLFCLDCGPPLEKPGHHLCMFLASTWFFVRWYLEDIMEELAQGAGNFLGIVQ